MAITNLINSIVTLVTGQTSLSIIDEDSNQPIWANIKCVSIDIESEASVTDNPIEIITLIDTPNTSTDIQEYSQTLKIIQPTRVRMNIICPDLDTMGQIVKKFSDLQSTLWIETKSVIIPSLCITEVDVEQDADMLSASRVNIALEQVTLATEIGGFYPLQSSDSSVYGIQFQEPVSITQTVSGLYTSISNRIANLL